MTNFRSDTLDIYTIGAFSSGERKQHKDFTGLTLVQILWISIQLVRLVRAKESNIKTPHY